MRPCKKKKLIVENTTGQQLLKTCIESTESLYANFKTLKEYITNSDKNEYLYSFCTNYLMDSRNSIISRITALKILNVTLVQNPQNLTHFINKGVIIYAYKLLKRSRYGINKKYFSYFGHNAAEDIESLVLEAKYLFTNILNIPLKKKSKEEKFIKNIYKKIEKHNIDVTVYRNVKNSDGELKYELENYKLELINLLEHDEGNYYKIDYTFTTYAALVENIREITLELLQNGEYKKSINDEDEIKIRYESHMLHRIPSSNKYKRSISENKESGTGIQEKGEINESKLKFLMNSKFFEDLSKKNTSRSSKDLEFTGSLSRSEITVKNAGKAQEKQTSSIYDNDNFANFETALLENKCDESNKESISKGGEEQLSKETSGETNQGVPENQKDVIKEDDTEKTNNITPPIIEAVKVGISGVIDDNKDNDSIKETIDIITKEATSEKTAEPQHVEDKKVKQKGGTTKKIKCTLTDNRETDKNSNKHTNELVEEVQSEGEYNEKQNKHKSEKESEDNIKREFYEEEKNECTIIEKVESEKCKNESQMNMRKQKCAETSEETSKESQKKRTTEFQNVFTMKDNDIWKNLIKKSNFYDIKEDFYNYYQFIKSKKKEDTEPTLGDLLGMDKYTPTSAHTNTNTNTNTNGKREEITKIEKKNENQTNKLNSFNGCVEKIMKTVGVNTEIKNIDSYEVKSDERERSDNEEFMSGTVCSINGSLNASASNMYARHNFINGISKRDINTKGNNANYIESELEKIKEKMKTEKTEGASLRKYLTVHDNIKHIRNTILKDHSILYDDDYCEIRMEQLFFGLKGILKIYIANKKNVTYSDVNIQVTNEILFPLKMKFQKCDTSLKFNSSNCYQLILKCLDVYKGFPSITISFRMQDMLKKSISLRLPIPINKFMKKLKVSSVVFNKFWNLPVFDINKKEKIILKNCFVDNEYLMKNACLGNALSVCFVDEKIHLCGCYAGKSKEEENSIVLLTLEEMKNDKLRIVCKSNSPILSSAILFLMIILFKNH